MEITFDDLCEVVADFAQIGYMEAVRTYEPPQDTIRKSEVYNWLKMMRVDFKTFNALVRKGLIKPRRSGTGVNSPLVYSKKEIKQALATARINKLVVNENIKEYATENKTRTARRRMGKSSS